MSLSKYYENSKLFEPDTIVKKEQSDKTGFEKHSKDTVTDETFHPTSEKFDSLPQTLDQKGNDTDPTLSSSKDSLPSSDVSGDQIDEIESEIEEESIDLTDYILIEEAKEQIEDAYTAGVQEGLKKADIDFGDAGKTLVSICQQLDTLRETIITNSSKELRDYALSIAERILRISVKEQDETIVATIDEALQRAVKSDEFTIYINPDDYNTVSQKAPDIISGLSTLANIIVKKDITIETGGAKIESENCTIDATLSSQFEMIREKIKQSL